MSLVQWHTLPPRNLPEYEEYTKISLDATYKEATPKLRERLDEFVEFLTNRRFCPNESFTELSYRYRDLYGSRPEYLNKVAIFVRVASIQELQAQVSAGWTWDRIIPYDAGPDCLGHPAKVWTPLVQNFILPYRDPSHNYGLTQINRMIHQTLTTVSETYACCGNSLDHPGCWKSKQEGKLVLYDLAPNFGNLVWSYVKQADWTGVQRLWEREPTVGSMWLHDEKYLEWDRRIRDGKALLSDSIVDVLKTELALRKVDERAVIDPETKLDPLAKETLNMILDLQNRWNKVMCPKDSSSYDLFNAKRGNEVLRELFFLFSVQVNPTWADEIREIQMVGNQSPKLPADAFDRYEQFARGQQNLENGLENLPQFLRELPQFKEIRDYLDTRVIGNAAVKSYLNDIIMERAQYDPSTFPEPPPKSIYLGRRMNAFLTFQPQSIDDYGIYEGLRRSEGFVPFPDQLRNQFIIVKAMGPFATPLDVKNLGEADQRQFEIVQGEKERLITMPLDEARQKLESWPSRRLNNYDVDFDSWNASLINSYENGTFKQFISSQNGLEESMRKLNVEYDRLQFLLESLKQSGESLINTMKEELNLRKGRNTEPFNARSQDDLASLKTIEDAEEMVETLTRELALIRAIPTDNQIFLAVQGLQGKWIKQAEQAQTIEQLREIERRAFIITPIEMENIGIWREDWPETKLDEGFARFDTYVTQDLLDEAKSVYVQLKERYEELLEESLVEKFTEADVLQLQVENRIPSQILLDFEATFNELKGRTERHRKAEKLIQTLRELAKNISDTIPTKEEVRQLIRDIDDENNTELYSLIRAKADEIKNYNDMQKAGQIFVNLQLLTKSFNEQLDSLRRKGYTEDFLKNLVGIVNQPKLTYEDRERAKEEFQRTRESLPELFPLKPEMKMPKYLGYKLMVAFFNAIPSTKLDEQFSQYRDSLLGPGRIGELKNVKQYQQCWEVFVRAILLFPGKPVDWLLAKLDGQIVNTPGDYEAVSDAIDNLLMSECLTLVPEEVEFEEFPLEELWFFPQRELIDGPDYNMIDVTRVFLEEATKDKYREEYPKFSEFVYRLAVSDYALRSARYLKGESEACNDAFIRLLTDIDGKPMTEVEDTDFTSFTTCLDLLDNTWIFIYTLLPEIDVNQSLNNVQLEVVRDRFVEFLDIDDIANARWPELYEFALKTSQTVVDLDCLRELVDYLKAIEGKFKDEIESDAELLQKRASVLNCIVKTSYQRIIDVLDDPVKLEVVVNSIKIEPAQSNTINLFDAIGGIKKESL